MSTMHYVASIPRKLPAGRVLVHNDVVRQKRLGSNGFRAWTQPLDAEPALESCDCGWSGLPHYRVKGVKGVKGAAETAPDRAD
jgi:hypothetical protein